MISSKDTEAIAALSRASTRPSFTDRIWSERSWVLSSLVITDTVAIALGFLIAYVLRYQADIPVFYNPEDSVFERYGQYTLILIPAWLCIFAIFQLYDFEHLFGGLEEYARVFNACTTGTMLVVVASFLMPDLVIARGWLLLAWFSVILTAGVGRFAVRRVVYGIRTRGGFQTKMLIVGADNEGKAIAEQLTSNSTSGISVVGFVDDELPKGTEVLPGLRVLGPSDFLRGLVQELRVTELAIASGAVSRERLLDIFHSFVNSDDVNVRMSSGLFEILTTGVRVKDIGHVPLLSVNRVRLTGFDVILKKAVDLVGATVGLILMSPVFLLIGVAIKRASPGPIFYRRRVVGCGGKEFDAFKFRTMVADADNVLEQKPELKAQFEESFKLKDDPRVTSIGRLLRRTSVDELPQLFNVLRGDMSLVGPRMITREEIAKYGKWNTNLFTVKPGITGLWQINGRSDVDYDGRVQLDMHYIRNYTIWLDLQILFQTIPAVLRKDGAY